MKNIRLIVSAIIGILILASCGASKKAVKSGNGRTELTSRCQDKFYENPAIRSVGIGTDLTDPQDAKIWAEIAARNEFQRKIETVVEGGAEDFNFDYNQASRDAVGKVARKDDKEGGRNLNESGVWGGILNNVTIVDYQIFRLDDGSYEAHVLLEYMGGISQMVSEIVEDVKQQVSDEDRAAIDIREEEFEKEIEERLKKYRDNQ